MTSSFAQDDKFFNLGGNALKEGGGQYFQTLATIYSQMDTAPARFSVYIV